MLSFAVCFNFSIHGMYKKSRCTTWKCAAQLIGKKLMALKMWGRTGPDSNIECSRVRFSDEAIMTFPTSLPVVSRIHTQKFLLYSLLLTQWTVEIKRQWVSHIWGAGVGHFLCNVQNYYWHFSSLFPLFPTWNHNYICFTQSPFISPEPRNCNRAVKEMYFQKKGM
jgi:hypothetical protein